MQTAQDVFVLVAAPGWNARALATSTDLTTRAIDANFNGRFDKKPAHAIGVYLFADAGANAFERVTEMTLARANASWTAWVKAL